MQKVVRPSVVALASVIPSVLACTGPCWGPETVTAEDLWVSPMVPRADLEAALSDGSLSREDCAALCAAAVDGYWVRSVSKVYSCRGDLGTRGSGAGGSGADAPDVDTGAGTGDTGEPPAMVYIGCEVDAVVANTCEGRRHATLRAPPRLATWFARSAWLEAASVGAFRRLRTELAAHGAPADLLEGARRAAADEIGHARLMRHLAGGRVARAEFGRQEPRDLVSIGIENAAEGCVGETFAATVAHHQARFAPPPLRPIFRRVAVDETRHGQWSWDLDTWLQTRLTQSERAEVDAARTRAWGALRDGPVEPLAVRRALGLPDAGTRRAWVSGLSAALG